MLMHSFNSLKNCSQVALLLLPVQAILALSKVPVVCHCLTNHPKSFFWVKTPHLFIIAETSRSINIGKRFSTRLVTKMWWLLLVMWVVAKQLKFHSTLLRKLMKARPPVVLFASFPDVFQFWQLKIV